jgi:TonB family protein
LSLTKAKLFNISFSNRGRIEMLTFLLLVVAATQSSTAITPVAQVRCPDGRIIVATAKCAPTPIPPPTQLENFQSNRYPVATPKGNPGSWVTTNDYPAMALREEMQGVSGFMLTVSPSGLVTDCRITASSGSPQLDQATCANVIRRARFDPALDAKRKPIVGYYSNRVRWQIPVDAVADDSFDSVDFTTSLPLPPRALEHQSYPIASDYPKAALAEGATGEVGLKLTIDPAGAIENCEVVVGSDYPELDEASCPYARKNWQFSPARDLAGDPSRGQIGRQLFWYPPERTAKDIPDDPPVRQRLPQKNPFADAGRIKAEFQIDASGNVTGCSSSSEGLAAMLGPKGIPIDELCTMAKSNRNAFEPFKDASGKPVARSVIINFTLEHGEWVPEVPAK